jgi:NAD(P)H-dependent FMN reductase
VTPAVKILALSGSLRAGSTNTELLRAAAALAPAGVTIESYEGIATLPHFNPDLEDALPPSEADLRARIASASGLLISCPEYAHGVPGSFKNALDWLVGGPEFVYKPVALFNASPRASLAQESLMETIRTMSGRIVTEASLTLPLLAKRLDAKEMVSDGEISAALRDAIAIFVRAIQTQ